MARLQGKVALITGAGAGIGRAAALRFAEEGAAVVLAELAPDPGREAEQAVCDAGGSALFVETDVTDEASVVRAVEATIERFDHVDLLYNCAGGSVAEDRPATDVDLSVWDHTIALDLKGTFLCCRHAIPRMLDAGGGAIVNMSSVAALKGVPTHVYTAAKGGVISLTRSLAAQYAGGNVRVNAICPGFVLSERVQDRFGAGGAESVVERVRKRYPFGVGEPVDIANVALFLLSDEARMITGATLPAEGGMAIY